LHDFFGHFEGVEKLRFLGRMLTVHFLPFAPGTPIWSGRSEVVERLLAETCELCGATDDIEVHHIRKLQDLDRAGQPPTPRWVKLMATRQRKTLVVCQACHHHIQYGRYDGPALSPKSHWRAG
jgi:hypothetical protein